MQTSSNSSAFQRLILGVFRADCHQPWHFDLGELNLAAPEGSQRLEFIRHCLFRLTLGVKGLTTYHICDLELMSWCSTHGDSMVGQGMRWLGGCWMNAPDIGSLWTQ